MAETAQTTTTRMYASIRDQLVSEIAAGVYPAGALLPSIREIMERWEVSTTTARKVLDELAAAGVRTQGRHARCHLDRGAATRVSAIHGRTRTQGAPASRSARPADCLARPHHLGQREHRPRCRQRACRT